MSVCARKASARKMRTFVKILMSAHLIIVVIRTQFVLMKKVASAALVSRDTLVTVKRVKKATVQKSYVP